MTPSTPETPSELALKAAVAIFPHGLPNCTYCHEPVEDSAAAIKRDQTQFALDIDRETNLPELLKQRDALREALKDLLRRLPRDFNNGEDRDPRSANHYGWLAARNAEAALALCDKQ